MRRLCRPNQFVLLAALTALLHFAQSGLGQCCQREPSRGPARVIFPERIATAYTIVLPGIWGDQEVDHGIEKGLKDARLQSAIEVYDWTAGPTRMVYNLRSLHHNCRQARKIAAHIVLHRARYPDSQVNLVGYSGGGALAVFVLEALPADCPISTAVLLAPTLSADYDLRGALARTEKGIHNFYSPLDVPVLGIACTAVGSTDGRHQLVGGLVGFERPGGESPHDCGYSGLCQHKFQCDMLRHGHFGGHFGWTRRSFAAEHLAPLLEPSACPSYFRHVRR